LPRFLTTKVFVEYGKTPITRRTLAGGRIVPSSFARNPNLIDPEVIRKRTREDF